MKICVCLTLFAALASASSASISNGSVNSDTQKDTETEIHSVQTTPLNNEYNRYRKSTDGGYSGANIFAPPCPKNYMFSCQPRLAPVPCSSRIPSYGSSGAYSVPVPTYVAPLTNNYEVSQGYNGFIPQNFNQFYQY